MLQNKTFSRPTPKFFNFTVFRIDVFGEYSANTGLFFTKLGFLSPSKCAAIGNIKITDVRFPKYGIIDQIVKFHLFDKNAQP